MICNKVRFLITIVLITKVCFAQELQTDMLYDREALRNYEEVQLEWTMTSAIQLHLNDALTNLYDKNFHVAIGALDSVISLDNQLWFAYYYRGVGYKLVGNFEEAGKNFKDAIRIKSDNFQPYLEAGKVEQILGNIESAESYYKKARKIDSSISDKVLYLLGNIDLSRGDIIAAKKKFLECTSINPSFHDAILRLGLIEVLKKGDSKAALAHVNKVLDLDSLHRNALHIRAVISNKDNPQQSIKDLNNLIKLDPTNLLYITQRAIISSEMNDFEKAFLDFQKVLQATPVENKNFRGKQTLIDKRIDIQNAGYYVMSQIYGLPEESASKIKKAYCLFLVNKTHLGIQTLKEIKGYQNSSLCLFLLGLGYEHFAQHEVAMKYYEYALAIDSEIQDAHTKLGIYNTNLSKWKASEINFSEAIRINPRALEVYKLRGVARFYLTDFDGAIKDFNEFLKYDSLNDEALKSRAISYLKIGEYHRGAIDCIKSATCHSEIRTFAEFITPLVASGDTTQALSILNTYQARGYKPEILFYQLDLLISQKKTDEALRLAENALAIKSISSNDNYCTIYLYLGVIYRMKNQLDKAEQFLSNSINLIKNSKAYLERGKLFMMVNKNKLAKKDLLRALEMGEPEAKVLLAKL